jgi:hypothetical protein
VKFGNERLVNAQNMVPSCEALLFTTGITHESRSTCPPHANSFVIGTAVINSHTNDEPVGPEAPLTLMEFEAAQAG